VRLAVSSLPLRDGLNGLSESRMLYRVVPNHTPCEVGYSFLIPEAHSLTGGTAVSHLTHTVAKVVE
jgi:hypothetical protein